MVDLWVWEKFWHPSRWPWVKVTKLPKRDAIYRNSAIFFRKILNPFSPVEHSICHILGTIDPIDVKQKGNESTWCYSDKGTFDLDLWPWIFKAKLYLGKGKAIVITIGTAVNMIPWCETLRKWVSWMLRWLGYLWPWIFKVKLYLRNGKPDCHGTKGTGVDSTPWCETLRKWVNWTLRWLGYLWPWHLTLNFHSQIVSREWEAHLSWNERDGSR